MNNRGIFNGVITMIIAVSLHIGMVYPATAQPTPLPASPLLEVVATRAERDAQLGVPLSVSDFRALFEAELENAHLSVREAHEHYETTYYVARANRPWWKSIMDFAPNAGWIFGAILLVYTVLKTQIETILKHSVNWVAQVFYRRVAGYRFFWWKGLSRYRRALTKKYQNVEVTFRPDRPLEMQRVYVPLRLTRGSSEQVDARQTIMDNRRIMVLGSPGSGKSMLMRRLALDYGLRCVAGLPERPVPIVLELNRVGGSEGSLEHHLAEILALNDFPNAIKFVEEHLKRGRLALLLDGLDEVNSSQRAGVVQKVKDLLDRYESCRVLITCRTAVYNDEFAGIADVTVKVVEFSDQQMQDFLFVWEPEFQRVDKSVEQLLRTLQERPRIREVARNPLMLTMIAFLYTDLRFVLPHSRAEFYRNAVDELIDLHSHLKLTEFKASQKRLVLQQLALLFQDRGDDRHEDRRSVPVREVIRAVVEILPQLNIEPTRAQPLLDEIVDRSGLLLSIDGGLRYQFAHLSLQEFFAAEAITREDELLAKFQANPNGWRESVKLWCGLDHDCTKLVKGVFASDALTAFECLADAQMIDEEISSAITRRFVDLLGKLTENRDLVLRAFGAVAADARPRGERVFALLQEAVSSHEEQMVLDAAEALSFTNTTQAVETLLKFRSVPKARSSLLRMGDLAVQQLAGLANSGEPEAIDDLVSVGTPKAALALVPLLWHEDEQTAWRVAAGLVTLTKNPIIENVLPSHSLTTDQRNDDTLEWVWAPFTEPPDSPVPTIMGRIAFLILTYTEHDLPRYADPRIVTPLLVNEPPPPTIETHDSAPTGVVWTRIMNMIEKEHGAGSLATRLWHSLTENASLVLYNRLTASRVVTEQDWQRHARMDTYRYVEGLHLRTCIVLHTLMVAAGFVGLCLWWLRVASTRVEVTFCVIISGIVAWALVRYVTAVAAFSRVSRPEASFDRHLREHLPMVWAHDMSLGPLRLVTRLGTQVPWAIRVVRGGVARTFSDYAAKTGWVDAAVAGAGVLALYGYLYWLCMWLTNWQIALGICIAPAVAIAVLWYAGARKEKAARNPLQGVVAEMSR